MDLLISNSRASYYIGGTEVVSMHQVEHLARFGHNILYVVRQVPEESKSEYFTDFEQRVRRDELPIEIARVAIDAPFGNGHSWDIWNEEARCFGEAAQGVYTSAMRKADASISHMSADALYLPDSKPQILHLHGSPKQRDELIDESMEHPTRTVAHAESIKQWWHNHYPDVPMDIFRNGVPFETFEHPVESDRPIDILYVGRLLAHKGVHDILAAANAEQKIVIAGSGNERDELQRTIRERSLDAELVDAPSQAEIIDLYKQSKIFACPSRGKEGVLTTMLEAGAAGCAVVTASGSGMTDLAKHRQNSRVVEPGDVAALSENFLSLLDDEPARLRIAKTMQDEIRENWSWEKRIKRLAALYEKAL
ncbi:hypothetical protein CR983_01690 [Candidatus Saccharibacteria bacterium]|nr:MAG: hypothetical protein CR983_01690 [Candidatus Saccharibacteria bacterium]